ncbi:MAG: hypothetical protein IJW94_05730, partial [Oscillospiraceae bacterium]|nr:hypothetical protein [Oscillospiraceae bacterium]
AGAGIGCKNIKTKGRPPGALCFCKFQFIALLVRGLGPLVLRGLSREQRDWGSLFILTPSVKIALLGNFASSLKTREPRALPRRSNHQTER